MLPNEEKEKKQREKRFLARRVHICVIILSVIFFGFIVRLFDWQIITGDKYKKLSANSTAYTVTTDATRGEILDCNGAGLAVNRTGYRVAIDKLFMAPENLNDIILKLIDLMNTRHEKWIDVLPISLSDEGEFRFRQNMQDEIKTLKSKDYLDLKQSDSAAKCMDMLRERYELDDTRDKRELLSLASVHYNMELTGYSNSNPYIFAQDISSDMVAIISENTQGINGVEIQTFLTRNNPSGTLAPHILGALGSISQEEYEEKTAEGKNYGFNDSIGKFGIEGAFEDELKGVGGERIVQKNAVGKVTKVARSVDAKPGHTIYLTIDKNLQSVANKALEKQINDARLNGLSEGKGHGEDCEAGAVVMLSVKDFSVLAAATYPSYDLNKYSNYDDYYIKLSTDKKAPLYDRAFTGAFAPGSVFKPCVAAAALEEGIITPYTQIDCTKYYNYYPTNPVACMGYHGEINLNSAIAQSCNYYFAETGRRLGIETMYLYAEKFGLGEKTGLEIDEGTGILAGRDSSVWQDGNTVQAAIGQSDNAFTPVQLAAYVATIANNGTRLKTHVVKEIRNYERTKTLRKYNKPEVLNTSGVSSQNLKYVQEAMRSVVASSNGTANSVFGNYKVKLAAKTGTAENSGSDHTVFMCYAPYEKPEVAIAVILEHGAHGKYSMGVAKSLLDEYFKKK